MAKKSIFKRWTGTAWEEFYFKTSADLIDETTTYKVLTATERTAISTYLTTFNAADLLVKINAANAAQDASKIDRSLIGDLSGTYLTKASPAFTGNMTGTGNIEIDGVLKALWDNTAYQFILSNSQEGFRLNASGGAYLQLDQGATFNTAVTVGTPTATGHATTKSYVDALISVGLRWAPGGPVEVASTGNIPSLSGLLTIDGVTLTAGQRVLVYKQDTASQNGIYIAAVGAWEKVLTDSAQGIMVFVMHGNTHNDWTFQATTATTWIETSKVDTYLAGSGITKTGLTFSISSDAITNAMLAGSISLADKTAAFTALDNANASYNTWGELTAATTSENITVKLNNLYAAIGQARGTANYNTNNTETIAGAYDLAEVKNRTYTGTDSEPSGLTLVTGDLYFYELA